MQLKIRVSCYHIDQNQKKLLSSKIKVNKKVLECNLKKNSNLRLNVVPFLKKKIIFIILIWLKKKLFTYDNKRSVNSFTNNKIIQFMYSQDKEVKRQTKVEVDLQALRVEVDRDR